MSSSSGLARLRTGLAAREVAFLLILAAGAWAATVALARGMAGMAGTMGLGLAAFVSILTLMMAAMMLPSVSPVASMYARTIQGGQAIRIPGWWWVISRSGRLRAYPPMGWPGSPAG